MSNKPNTMPVYRPTKVGYRFEADMENWQYLQTLEKGTRARFINDAIREKIAKDKE